MASRLLSMMATTSVSSAGGTWNFASAKCRSSMKASDPAGDRPFIRPTGLTRPA
jgi:hypothetical protein